MEFFLFSADVSWRVVEQLIFGVAAFAPFSYDDSLNKFLVFILGTGGVDAHSIQGVLKHRMTLCVCALGPVSRGLVLDCDHKQGLLLRTTL